MTFRATGQRARLLVVGLGTCAVLSSFAAPAFAVDVDKLRVELSNLEAASRGLSIRFQPQASGQFQQAEHRLVDAQVLYNLKDYTRAAILLLDYVQRYKNTRGYPEAVFFLADSLYYRRDYLSAKRYFEQIINEVRGPYYQEALQRLIELSLKTGDTSEVKRYLDALASIPDSQLKPSVPYVRGKYYYFNQRDDMALRSFNRLRPDQEYYMQAQYFIGAIQVRRKDYAGALKTYQALLKHQPSNEDQKQVLQLAHLAVGRLLYQENRITEAIDAYQRVSRHSDAFDLALYEIAWAYVKAQQYERALRALDLLALAQPDSPLLPDVSVLRGNLMIRLKHWGRATEVFTSTKETFMPAEHQLSELLATHQDPNVFFDALLRKELGTGKLAMAITLPKLARRWVRQQPNVKRSLTLVKDLRQIETSLEGTQRLIDRLERVVNSPARVKIFPEYAVAREHAIELENRVSLVRRALITGEIPLVQDVLTSDERVQLDALEQQRAQLDRQIQQLPTTKDSMEQRTSARVAKIQRLEGEVTRLAILIQNMKAQLVAIEKYFTDTGGAKDDATRESFLKEVEATQLTIDGLESESDELTAALADAHEVAGVGGPQEVAERSDKQRYRELVSREHALLAPARARLSGSQRTEAAEVDALFQRCAGVDGTLDAFNARIDQGVEAKLADVRKAIGEEKAYAVEYKDETAMQEAEADTVAGAITHRGLQNVAERFHDIAVRADVGIIDVAWALKDSKTKEVTRLVRQRKMDIKLLDDEFKQVLAEGE